MKKATEAMATPVIQVNNVLRNRYTKNSAYELAHRVSNEFKANKAEGKNYIKVFGPDGCFVLCETKSNGKLTAHGQRLREAFLAGYQQR